MWLESTALAHGALMMMKKKIKKALPVVCVYVSTEKELEHYHSILMIFHSI